MSEPCWYSPLWGPRTTKGTVRIPRGDEHDQLVIARACLERIKGGHSTDPQLDSIRALDEMMKLP